MARFSHSSRRMDQKRRRASEMRAAAVAARSQKRDGAGVDGCGLGVGFGGHWAAPVYELGGWDGWRAVGRGLVGLADEGYEDVGDGGGADVAQGSELFAGDAVVEEDGAAEGLAGLDRLERLGGRKLTGVHDELEVAGVEVFHAAAEDEVAAVDEEEVGEDVLDLIDLMGGDDDGAVVVEVVVEQGVVELLAEEDVEAEGGLVED